MLGHLSSYTGIDIMETAIIKLLTGNPEPWQIFVGISILFLVVIPRLFTLRDSWVAYRQNRGHIEQQKRALELLKLQYEIEALRKKHDLQEISSVDSRVITPKEEKTSEIQPSPFWLLLIKHPVIGEILIRLVQGITGLYLLLFGLVSLAMPFMFFFKDTLEADLSEKMDPLFMALGWLFYIILTYFLFRGYRRIKQWAKDLRSDVRRHEISRQEQNEQS
jgi:hypothetical protein